MSFPLALFGKSVNCSQMSAGMTECQNYKSKTPLTKVETNTASSITYHVRC